MKADREHRVPLSRRVFKDREVIHENRVSTSSQAKAGQAIVGMVLRRMKIEGATVYGFRSTFRD
jgi:hypothetical protein